MSTAPNKLTRKQELEEKVELNELRARDAEARRKIVEAEMKILSLRESVTDEDKSKNAA